MHQCMDDGVIRKRGLRGRVRSIKRADSFHSFTKQRKALEETKAVIPTVRERITSAREKLESLLVRGSLIISPFYSSRPMSPTWPMGERE